MRRRGRAIAALAAAVAVVTVAGCGRDDFDNEPRPPLAEEVSVKVGAEDVSVSPAEFGAGIANFTIANLGDTPITFELDGPSVAASEEIAPGTTGRVKTELVAGEYEASAEGTDATPFEFEVVAERESAQNDLLLP